MATSEEQQPQKVPDTLEGLNPPIVGVAAADDGQEGGGAGDPDVGVASSGMGLPVAEGGGPLSPLSGAYLLIILSEPISDEHKAKMLQKVKQGLVSWDLGSCHVDLNKELDIINECSPPGEELKGGERLIQFATDNLVIEVLIHPQLYTLQQCMRNMLGSFTKHRHIIHGGYTFAGSGSWVLQDGAYTYSEFARTFEEYEVQRVMRAYENSISINLHCCEEGDFVQDRIDKEQYSEFCQVKLNPSEVIQIVSSIESFVTYVDPFLVPQSTQQSLPPSDVVGNIRFSHPTLYVFPGGQGDSALFGINGFNMLIDGGFSRKACFWDFSRHLDRLDAILITRLSDENTSGMSALLQRKTMSSMYPQIGHVFANLPTQQTCRQSQESEKRELEGCDREDSLLINVIEEGNFMLENLRILNLKPQVCFRERSCEPINLYHKVGHGKLDMYVVNPSRDAKELREFMERWNENAKTMGTLRSGINVDGKELWLPIANLVSICALVVWIPDDVNDTVTRLLFPGSTPQHKVLRGLEKMKSLEFIQKPVCISGSLPRGKPSSPVKSAKHGPRESSSQRTSYHPTTTTNKKVPRPEVAKAELRQKTLSSKDKSRAERETKDSTRVRRSANVSESSTVVRKSTYREKTDSEKPSAESAHRDKRSTKVGGGQQRRDDKLAKEQKNQAAEAKAKESKKDVASKPRTISSRYMQSKKTEKPDVKHTTTARSLHSSKATTSTKTTKEASNKTKKAADVNRKQSQ